MRYIVTLINIGPSQAENVGARAMDLAALREKGLNVPLSLVVNSQAFEDFMAENSLKQKIDALLQKKTPEQAYEEIIQLFLNSELPKNLKNELMESYASLNIDQGSNASSIVSKWDLPFVNLIRSPAYLLGVEDREGVFQNIRGEEMLIGALRLVWASHYSPLSISYRKRAGLKDEFKTAVIVQKMKKIVQSAEAYSYSGKDDKTIVVKSFIGMQDLSFDKEIMGKDVHEVNVNSLMIVKSQINVQEYFIERDLATEELMARQVREDGSRQKLDDKQVAEVARITKRAKSFLGKDIKIYFEIKDDFKYILLANERAAEPKPLFEEIEEIKVKVDGGKETILEHKHEINSGAAEEGEPEEEFAPEEPMFKIPELLSKDEAKAKLLQDEELDGHFKAEFEEAKPKVEPKVEIIQSTKSLEEEKAEQAIEQEVEKEVNLLEEALEIKEITEKMEEHALNDNKESYNQEARKLKEKLRRIRSE